MGRLIWLHPCLIFLASVLHAATSATNANVVNIGLICNFSGYAGYVGSASAITLALNALQNNGYLLNTTFNVTWMTDGGANAITSIGNALQLIQNVGVDILFGPPTSANAPSVGYLNAYLNFPWWGWLLRDPQFNPTQYPTMIRSTAGYDVLSTGLLFFMNKQKWRNVATIVYTDATQGRVCNYVISSFNLKAAQYNVTVAYTYQFAFAGPDYGTLVTQLTNIKNVARIIFLCALDVDVRRIMIAADSLDMTDGSYVYMTTNAQTADMGNRTQWYANDGLDSVAFNAYLSLFYITFEYIALPINSTFNQMVLQANTQPPWNITLPAGTQADSNAPYLYDLTYLYGLTLTKVRKAGNNIRNGAVMQAAVANTTFFGQTGNVLYDQTSMRISSFYLWQLDPVNGTLSPSLRLAVQSIGNGIFTFQTTPLSNFYWNTPDGSPPPNEPACGFRDQKCLTAAESNLGIILGISIPVVFLLIVTTAAFVVVKLRNERLEREGIWRIDLMEISFRSHASTASSRMENKSASTIGSTSVTASTDASHNTASSDVSSSKIGGIRDKKIQLATYKGELVVVKHFKHINPAYKSGDNLLILKFMKECNHPNVINFYGACLSAGGEEMQPFFVSPFCQRGSLTDVLANHREEFKMDRSFKISFIGDIIKGMQYLHSTSLKSHGNLKSTNCLIDIRWTLRIADFGLHALRVEMLDEKANMLTLYTDMYWTAPELLRSRHQDPQGSPEGDVYSFAIILSEILSEQEPYNGENPQEVVTCVRNTVEPIRRPKIPLEVLHEYGDFVRLMRDCWSEEPRLRPSFAKLRQKLKDLTGGKEIVLVDEMLVKMEKYTMQLEETVQQRTSALAEEKKKADVLLYRMLPGTIAEILKMGQTVPPDSCECASVMFTDIVRFTCIASHSTPHQIVHFLNMLYNEFDCIIKNHDAYKVETIGDAYMIVSGMPVRNGSRHALELGDVALEFLSAVLGFQLAHLPDVPVMIRVGIDSGPVCSGVIGSLMPHFCLFGDTVNTASRMESHGQREHKE